VAYPQAPQVATSADLSNVVAMVDSAFTIARDDSGVPWGGETEWNFPDPNADITPPHLAVVLHNQQPWMIGYRDIGQWLPPAQEAQQVWMIGVYALFPYEFGSRDTYVTPLDCAVRLQRAFRMHINLDGQCDEVKVGPAVAGPVAERRPGDPPNAASGPIRWYGGYVTVIATEMLTAEFPATP
jgi:hypothetical protein